MSPVPQGTGLFSACSGKSGAEAPLFSLSKKFFDKLRAVFQNFLSSEKPVIANERHP
jgi:hypothetical protein